ncbi:hypothetical protein [Pedobacter punctiformis]|uniref:ABC transporter permease n=1 Tax=Pedobacter punctiformis TaxID=3004097 RepID=A0ABT4L9P0_9SPHI|nr:hypothetical protein [Pedobacter sp. HCMS5-2]MCZ4244626.1 hypothetical protein [Pedobacter sp. HCMS5-2]
MHFSFPRFFNLFIKQWAENKKLYLLGAIAVPIILATITLFFPITDSRLTSEVQNIIFGFSLFIFGGIFGSSLLSVYTPKSSGIRMLMLPVSSLEKLLVAVIYGLVLFPLLYFILGYPVMLLVHQLDSEVFGNLNRSISVTPRNIKIIYCLFLMIQSFVLFCSLYFKKFIFLKAFLSFIIIFLFFSLLNGLIIKIILSDTQPTEFSQTYQKKMNEMGIDPKKINFENATDNASLFSDMVFKSKYSDHNKIKADETVNWIPFSLCVIIFISLLTASLFKLKETQL